MYSLTHTHIHSNANMHTYTHTACMCLNTILSQSCIFQYKAKQLHGVLCLVCVNLLTNSFLILNSIILITLIGFPGSHIPFGRWQISSDASVISLLHNLILGLTCRCFISASARSTLKGNLKCSQKGQCSESGVNHCLQGWYPVSVQVLVLAAPLQVQLP